MKATKLEKKQLIGRRYSVIKSLLSSKNTSSRPKTNKPISASKTPILIYVESLGSGASQGDRQFSSGWCTSGDKLLLAKMGVNFRVIGYFSLLSKIKDGVGNLRF